MSFSFQLVFKELNSLHVKLVEQYALISKSTKYITETMHIWVHSYIENLCLFTTFIYLSVFTVKMHLVTQTLSVLMGSSLTDGFKTGQLCKVVY